ncbi:MAG: outer membrane protein assembly factor BamE [Azoarcus sp.]|jgi:outer membrane protein assembly factor BamE|nr:outer membrane protein assembly factor BamE [Azoarcus sp.]
MRSPFSLAPLIMALALSACSFFAPYRIDVRQGNFVDQTMLTQLRPGMTRDQVRFILGSPLIVDAFRADRWDYVYRFKRGSSGDVEQRTVSVYFVNDVFDHVDGDMGDIEGDYSTQNRTRVIEVPKAKD